MPAGARQSVRRSFMHLPRRLYLSLCLSVRLSHLRRSARIRRNFGEMTASAAAILAACPREGASAVYARWQAAKRSSSFSCGSATGHDWPSSKCRIRHCIPAWQPVIAAAPPGRRRQGVVFRASCRWPLVYMCMVASILAPGPAAVQLPRPSKVCKQCGDARRQPSSKHDRVS
jgi:hypothetical protein